MVFAAFLIQLIENSILHCCSYFSLLVNKSLLTTKETGTVIAFDISYLTIFGHGSRFNLLIVLSGTSNLKGLNSVNSFFFLK